MQWLRSIFWPSATNNFQITARYIPSKANTIADAISHLHDPAFCRTVKELFHTLLVPFDHQQAQVSQSVFSSLPWQVQSMFRSSYYRKNWECTTTMPLPNPQQQVISRSYEHTFTSVSSSAIPQFPVTLFTSPITLCWGLVKLAWLFNERTNTLFFLFRQQFILQKFLTTTLLLN